MRLREYIDKSLEQEDPRNLLVRAIDLARDYVDMEKIASMIASMSKDMSNEDLMFINQYYEKVISKFNAELRKVDTQPGSV